MTTKNRPSFIFIVADDLGFADLGCYGGRDADFGPVSPVLDRLAAAGLKFTQGCSNLPVCLPTRFGLMTARYQYRLRGAAEEPINSKSKGSSTLGLPPEHPTLPSLLKGAGYRTALMGKWHLGYPPAFGPLKSGYEEFFGPMSGGVDYFTHCSNNGTHDLYLGDAEHQAEGYLTDLITDRSVDYIQRMADGARGGTPFFLSVHYTAPHWPWETRDDAALAQEVKDNLFHLHGGNIPTYRRMIHHMDEGIGKLVDTLRAQGLLDNTLIVFTSDNGGERFSDNWPLVGGKMDLTEGGIRVPYVVRAPGRIPAGAIGHQLIMTMDWAPTFLEAAGVAQHPDYPMDGRSLWPILRQPHAALERDLFWRMKHRGQQAARSGPWKYLAVDGHEYLFNLDADARERANQRHRAPERFDAMKQRYAQWQATMPPIPADAMVTLPYSKADMP